VALLLAMFKLIGEFVLVVTVVAVMDMLLGNVRPFDVESIGNERLTISRDHNDHDVVTT